MRWDRCCRRLWAWCAKTFSTESRWRFLSLVLSFLSCRAFRVDRIHAIALIDFTLWCRPGVLWKPLASVLHFRPTLLLPRLRSLDPDGLGSLDPVGEAGYRNFIPAAIVIWLPGFLGLYRLLSGFFWLAPFLFPWLRLLSLLLHLWLRWLSFRSHLASDFRPPLLRRGPPAVGVPGEGAGSSLPYFQ